MLSNGTKIESRGSVYMAAGGMDFDFTRLANQLPGSFKIGVCSGPVFVSDHGLIGSTVCKAARVC